MLIPVNSHVGCLLVPCVVNKLVHDLVQEVHHLNPYVVGNRGLTKPASVVISLDYQVNKLIIVSGVLQFPKEDRKVIVSIRLKLQNVFRSQTPPVRIQN